MPLKPFLIQIAIQENIMIIEKKKKYSIISIAIASY